MKDALAIIYDILIRPLVEAINNHATKYGGGVVAGNGAAPAADKPGKAGKAGKPAATVATVPVEDLKAVAQALVKLGKGAEAKAIITGAGFAKTSDVTPDKSAEVKAALDAALEAAQSDDV